MSTIEEIKRCMDDDNLYPLEKLVMVAYLIYGRNAADETILHATGLSADQCRRIAVELWRKDWLTASEEHLS